MSQSNAMPADQILEQSWPYQALWQVLDKDMANEFQRLQWQADSVCPLQEWDDEGRLRWWRWIEEEDGLCEIDCLRVLLWYRLWGTHKEMNRTNTSHV